MKSFLDLINEEKSGEKHHVMTFGRMNPPTTGHMKLIDKVHEVAKKHGASHSVVTSHSQDSKKNPLSASQKLKHLKRYSPDTHFEASSKEHPTILHHAAKVHKSGATHLHVVVGSDRVKEMHHLLHKYNGVEGSHGKYHFKKITVHSAGHRDPDSEGSEGMSATKMREHAKNKNHAEFRKGVPSHVSDHHSHELMKDVRKGMGLHEQYDRGMFKVIFVTGGPGSGKDIVIREAIAEARAVELNLTQAFDLLADKQKLSEKTNDYRREAIRNRGPLIINGPADSADQMFYVKEELEDLGYESMMVFVDTTNEASKERNEKLSRMMLESVRYDKWVQAQNYKNQYKSVMEQFISLDNSGTLDNIEEDITEIYNRINGFLDTRNFDEIAEQWLEINGRLNINEKFINIFKEDENAKTTSKSIQKATYKRYNPSFKAAGPADISPDNRAGDPSSGDPKWNANKRTGGYTFRAYTEEKGTTIQKSASTKESNFSQDKETIKKKGKRFSDAPTVSQRMRNVTGIGQEFDTRQQGTVYPMSGLGDVTYREQKDFSKFRKTLKEFNGFQNDTDMGVGGVLGGSTNVEKMDSYKDMNHNVTIDFKKKKKKQEK